MPIMDGSSEPFIDAIEQVGVRALAVKRRYIRIVKPVRIESGASWSEFTPYDGMRFEVEIDFDCPLIGRQAWKGELTPATFRSELSRARTFGFMRDVEKLWKSGLALGASLENTVAIGDDRIMNPEGLRYPQEFVRHKMLDAVGDLALAGAPLLGAYKSVRGGHRLNAHVVQALLADPDAWAYVHAPRVREGIPVDLSLGMAAANFAADRS
jgi:UDP-3-O-[3-hydroxymyristoyl] N-acetylglucosamine deacetylase